MNNTLCLRAPAKINLYLKIINRRKDGYHNLLSLMQMIGLYDELHFEETEKELSLQIQNSTLPADQCNLVLRAARLLQKTMCAEDHAHKGAAIRLKKEIPVAAGLAGGSSDAVATLIGLNHLWKLNWPKKKLARLSEKLGSDLPFFFDGPTAWVTGRGECVESIQNPFKTWILLLNPGIPISTASVFQDFSSQNGLTNTETAIKISAKQGRPTLAEVYQTPHNDLERVTLNRVVALKPLKSRLRRLGGKLVLMSGSGPSIFGTFESQEQAALAAGQIREFEQESSLKIWVLPFLQISPFSEYV
ncbi:4-diphosphocytidyl-2-C-methyl-D-erythritol kinase [hydrothermal vent metagenome]|uniref:4-(cytidine 5'-diphospho)-2-C-methyl-D-erythritol kinase n=1 Tax=hydrothermal vent metagenome TaxID=652676 RepID=A0A3B1DLB1_9ZZZZ